MVLKNTLFLLFSTFILIMDALSVLLELLKLKSIVYFKSDFSSPWGMDVPKGNFAQFHMLVKGKCKLKIKGEKTVDLYAGDIVIFPFGE